MIITILIFSGRPNPKWILADTTAHEASELLRTASRRFTADGPPGVFGMLGYRGLAIQIDDFSPPLYIHGGIIATHGMSPNWVDEGRAVERFLLSQIDAIEGLGTAAAGARSLPASVREHIEQNLALDPAEFPRGRSDAELFPNCPQVAAQLAPLYTPMAWNFNPNLMQTNNCYNYACNKITGTFAQPGRASTPNWPGLTFNCFNVGGFAQSDGLVGGANFTTTLQNGFYVALVMWPGVDYHWYRQDQNGCWSHKPGSTPVINVDNAHVPITDPSATTCNRGPYTDFCDFEIVMPAVVKIV